MQAAHHCLLGLCVPKCVSASDSQSDHSISGSILGPFFLEPTISVHTPKGSLQIPYTKDPHLHTPEGSHPPYPIRHSHLPAACPGSETASALKFRGGGEGKSA